MLNGFLVSAARVAPIGGSHILKFAARYNPALQATPVRINNIPYEIFIDLRDQGFANFFLHGDGTGSQKLRSVLPQIVQPGDIFYDIGANIGLVSAVVHHAIGPSGTLIAFEPNPAVNRLYEMTFGGHQNVILNKIALADQTGEIRFYPAPISGRSSLSPIEGVKPIFVSVRTLADMIAEFGLPDVLKVDVEGHEATVFSGAQGRFHGDSCPVIIFEALRVSELQETMTVIAGLHRGSGKFFNVCEDGKIASVGQIKHSSDYIYVPKHKLDRVQGVIFDK